MSKRSGKLLKRKRVIVFAFEGKNNKTESLYFSHFCAFDDEWIIHCFSSGVTDPKGMLLATKKKRKKLDYNPKEDLTFIFMDGDCDKKKKALINDIRKSLPKDIRIIVSCPCFEIWFLNHFVFTGKEYRNNDELLKELDKHLKGYDKNIDYYSTLCPNTDAAIINSTKQKANSSPSNTEVVDLFSESIIKHHQ